MILWQLPSSKSIPDVTTLQTRGVMQSTASEQINSKRLSISQQKMRTQPSVNSLQTPIKCTGSLIGATGKGLVNRQTSFHVWSSKMILDFDRPSLSLLNHLRLLSQSNHLPVWRKSSSGRGIHILGTQKQLTSLRRYACPVWKIWMHRGYSLLFDNKGLDYAGEWGQDESILFEVLIKFNPSYSSRKRGDGNGSLSPKREIRWPSASELDQINSILLMGLDMPQSLDCSDCGTGGG